MKWSNAGFKKKGCYKEASKLLGLGKMIRIKSKDEASVEAALKWMGRIFTSRHKGEAKDGHAVLGKVVNHFIGPDILHRKRSKK